MNIARQQLWRTGLFTGGGHGGSGDSIYAPGEMARVSGARFVWHVPVARAWVLEDASFTYSGAPGVGCTS